MVIRLAESDADLEAWRQVRIAVLPHERTATVEEMHAMASPQRLVLIAERDGFVVGSGLADLSSNGSLMFVAPRVVPEARRRGVGTALLRALVPHAYTLRVDRLTALSEDDGSGSLEFGAQFGFEEADRQVEQVRTLAGAPSPALLPDGVELVSIAERPELLAAAYTLGRDGYADMATPWPVTITREEWVREEATYPAGSFAALAGGEIVGYSGLMRDSDDPARAEDGLTVVRRDWRGRGLATALKQAELAWAAANGLHEVYTWTQRGNEGMRRLNERLGYEYRHVAVTLHAPLDRVERALRD